MAESSPQPFTLDALLQLSAAHSYASPTGEADDVPLPGPCPQLLPGITLTLPVLPVRTLLLPGETLPVQLPRRISVSLSSGTNHGATSNVARAACIGEQPLLLLLLPPSTGGVGIIAHATRVRRGGLWVVVLARQRGSVARAPRAAPLCAATGLPLAAVNVLDGALGDEASAAPPREALAGLAHHAAAVFTAHDPQRLAVRVARAWRDAGHAPLPRAALAAPTALSWWLLRTAPVSEAARASLFAAPCAAARLRALERVLLAAAGAVAVACARCGARVVTRRGALAHPFAAVAARGGDTLPPYTFAFVNPAGISFRLITSLCMDDGATALVGTASTESSWFPRFAWTIEVCAECHFHLGWRFDWRGGGAARRRRCGSEAVESGHDSSGSGEASGGGSSNGAGSNDDGSDSGSTGDSSSSSNNSEEDRDGGYASLPPPGVPRFFHGLREDGVRVTFSSTPSDMHLDSLGQL